MQQKPYFNYDSSGIAISLIFVQFALRNESITFAFVFFALQFLTFSFIYDILKKVIPFALRR